MEEAVAPDKVISYRALDNVYDYGMPVDVENIVPENYGETSTPLNRTYTVCQVFHGTWHIATPMIEDYQVDTAEYSVEYGSASGSFGPYSFSGSYSSVLVRVPNGPEHRRGDFSGVGYWGLPMGYTVNLANPVDFETSSRVVTGGPSDGATWPDITAPRTTVRLIGPGSLSASGPGGQGYSVLQSVDSTVTSFSDGGTKYTNYGYLPIAYNKEVEDFVATAGRYFVGTGVQGSYHDFAYSVTVGTLVGPSTVTTPSRTYAESKFIYGCIGTSLRGRALATITWGSGADDPTGVNPPGLYQHGFSYGCVVQLDNLPPLPDLEALLPAVGDEVPLGTMIDRIRVGYL
jgi:hypothetical protein